MCFICAMCCTTNAKDTFSQAMMWISVRFIWVSSNNVPGHVIRTVWLTYKGVVFFIFAIQTTHFLHLQHIDIVLGLIYDMIQYGSFCSTRVLGKCLISQWTALAICGDNTAYWLDLVVRPKYQCTLPPMFIKQLHCKTICRL